MQVLVFLIVLWVQPVPILQGVSQHLDTEDGLSNNIVYDIYQDREGYIWIATENGLNRFDGYSFKKFYHSRDDSSSLSSNIVRSITEDENGTLWIGTFNGLNSFNRKTETFTRYIDLPKVAVATNRLDLKQMQLSGNDKLWFNTLSITGWFDIRNKEFHFIEPNIEPYSISIGKGGRTFIQTKEGRLLEYSDSGEKSELFIEGEKYVQHPIHFGKYTNKLWTKSAFPASEVSISRANIPELPNGIVPTILLEIDEDRLLIGSDEGLFVYSMKQMSWGNVDFGEKASTLTNSIRSLYQDNNGGIWVGTLNGVFHFNPYQKPFTHIDIAEKESDIVMGMAEWKDEILINAFSRTLIAYNEKEKSTRELNFSIPPPRDFFQIWDIEISEETNGVAWLATNAGLFLYNPEKEVLKHIPLAKADESFPATFSIFNEQDFLWVSSVFALYKLEKSSGEIIKVIKSPFQPLASIIQDIHKVGDTFLIATEGDGIFKYEEGDSTMKPLGAQVEDANQLQTVPVWDLYESKDNVIWLGTNRGLYRFNLENSAFDFISTGTALENTVIFSIQEDGLQNLWLGTEKGLIKYNPVTQKITSYSKSDGILNVEFNRKSSFQTEDGRLFFGGIEGITVFNPAQIQSNPIVPPVYITNAQVVTTDSIFTPNGLLEKEINLGWNQNTLEIAYTALNFTNPSQNLYKYKLEGYDPTWVNAGDDRTARYVQLPHGEYTFVVQASNNDGIWNTDGATLQINITPPFWKTWWFRVFVFLSALLILWRIYRYRVKQLLEIERVKLRIAGDLHDEIGSGLSGIALTGDILSKQLNNGGAKPELVERITQSSRSLASSLDTIVWLIDPKKETLGDLISKCQITAQELLGDKRVKLSIEIKEKDGYKVMSSAHRRNLFLFFKEAVHNIAKHSNADEVEIQFSKKEEYLEIDIQDNGVGFNSGEAKAGRGIGTMHQRAKELQSDLMLESRIGEGTSIKLKAKIP